MKLYALSDLPLLSELNWQAVTALPPYPEDWLLLAGNEAKYQRLVAICHDHGMLTSEDPYRVWSGAGCVIRAMPITDSGAWRSPNPGHADHQSGVGRTTLDNLSRLGQARLHISSGERDVPGKVIHAQTSRSAPPQVGAWTFTSRYCPQLRDLTSYGE